eukprot:COSAG02_NODE_12433_length_1545_cov_1.751037_1_plen_118_part_10
MNDSRRWDPRPTGAINGHGAHAAWTSKAGKEMSETTRFEIASGALSIQAEFDKLISDDATLLRFWHDHRGDAYRVPLEGGSVHYDLEYRLNPISRNFMHRRIIHLTSGRIPDLLMSQF